MVPLAIAVSMAIGPRALPSQRPGGPIDVVRIENRTEPFREEFEERLHESQPSTWHEGWQLAEDLGASAAGLLFDMWEEEASKLERRLLFQGAHSLAAGPGGEPAYGPNLRSLKDREKVMALLILASGPARTRAIDGLARLTDRGEEILVRVAAYLALARQGIEPPPLPRTDRDDSGLLAAALYAGLSVPERELRAWFRDDDRDRPEFWHLVWRGFLLAEPQPDRDRDRRLERADDIVREPARSSNRGSREVRRAATLCLARLGEPDSVLNSLPDPDVDTVLLLATYPRMRERLSFEAVSGGLIDPHQRRRLAVLYALHESPDSVLAAADEWTADTVIRGPICLAVSINLLGRETAAVVPDSVTALPEGAWVQWAAGEEPRSPTATGPGAAIDELLARALPLALAGQLPADTAALLLEEALWRSGSHPGLARVEAHMALLQDLLLSGSTHVSAALGIDAQYLPAGISRTDYFFEVAYQFLQFVAVPRTIPDSLRLR